MTNIAILLFYVKQVPAPKSSLPLRWLQRLQIVFSISLRSHDSSPEATNRQRKTRAKLRNVVLNFVAVKSTFMLSMMDTPS